MARRRTNDAKIDPALFRRGASSVTLSEDVIAAYLSILREEGRTGQSLRLCETVLRQFLAFLPDGVITKDSLPAWREQLLSEGFAIRTVNCRVSTVSALLDYAKRNGRTTGAIFTQKSGAPLMRTQAGVYIQKLGQDARIPAEKANIRALRHLHKAAVAAIEANFNLLVQQAYERQLEVEEVSAGW